MQGWFTVAQDAQDERDIAFGLVPGLQGEPPEDQLSLKSDVEATLTSLRLIYLHDDASYKQFFRQLLALAQAGLVGPHAQPIVATRALLSLKADVVAKEGAKVKNRYMRELGRTALVLAAVPLAIYVVIGLLDLDSAVRGFALLWVGCMAGVWLSYGYRRATITFADLAIPESDRLEPFMRLCFAGVLTEAIGLMLFKQVISVEIAGLATASLATDPAVALIVGLVCGISELVLPGKVAKRAAEILGV